MAGALAGGIVSYLWGETNLDSARHALDALPAISIGMLDHAQHALATDGMFAAFVGSFSGVPYFVLASIPARGFRFTVLAMMTRALARYAAQTWTTMCLCWAWALVWIVNYSIYWTIMPN